MKCLYCGKEFIGHRESQRFCSISCCKREQYKDKDYRKRVTKKANEIRRKKGLEKFKENPTIRLGKRGYYLIYIPSLISDKDEGYWKKYHHYLWEKENGKIPEGYCLHHINGVRTDNDLDNLQLITIKEHDKIPKNYLRGKEHPFYKEGTLRPGSKFICEYCKKEGIRTRYNQKVCSSSCASKLRWSKPNAREEMREKNFKRNNKGQFINQKQ
jgi:hypothetical protein